MQRRRFLLATGGGLLTMLGPGWLRRAFGDASLAGSAKKEDPRFGDQARRRALAEAKLRAKKSGRRLVVFVIPRDESLLWDRGHAFGELLTHGTPAELAPLAHVEVACATLADLGMELPPKKEPLFALLEPDGNNSSLVGFGPFPTLAEAERRVIDPVDGQRPIDEDALIERRIGILSGLLEQLLGRSPAPALGQKVRTRYATEPPSGTHWATDSSCGPARVDETRAEKAAREAEEKRQAALGMMISRSVVGYGCGMGHVPQKSIRFLYFFTQDPDA